MHFETHKQLQKALNKAPTAKGAFRFLPEHNGSTYRCSVCKDDMLLNTKGSGGGTGYGNTLEGDFICYACCGKRDSEQLERDGKGMLYLSSDNGKYGTYELGNWPGTLKIKLQGTPKKGYHNRAGCRYDVWYWWNGKLWHGVQYGDNTQVCHVKRAKG